jgi:hypothetical protein
MSRLPIDLVQKTSFRIFRIHVSGDFFSAEYARAWSIACGKSPDRKFWTYTRIREVATLTELAGVSNLAITLSCDRDNWKHMPRLSRRFPSFGLCYYSVGETPPSEVYAWGEAVPARKTSGLIVFVDHACRGTILVPAYRRRT